MNTKPIAVLAALAFLAGGCGKSPAPSTAGNSDSQSPPPIQAEPFLGQVYKSLDGRTVLTLISKDECELANGRTTLLCKYSKQDGKLRVVTTALGTSQVIYFRFSDEGIEDNDGNVLFSQEGLAAKTRQLQLEEQRAVDEKVNAVRETKTISTIQLTPFLYQVDTKITPDQLVLTDVSLKLHYPKNYGVRENPHILYFTHIKKIHDVEIFAGHQCFDVEYGNPGNPYDYLVEIISRDSAADTQATRDAVLKAYDAWKTRFPKAVWKK